MSDTKRKRFNVKCVTVIKKREKNQKCIKLWIVFLRHLNEGTLKHVPRFLQWTLVAPHCPLRYSSPCKPCGTLFKRNISNGTIEEGFIQEKAKVVAASWGDRSYKISFHPYPFRKRTIWRTRWFARGRVEESGGQISLFFKSSWCKIVSAARNWSNSVPQGTATTFGFSSVWILLLKHGTDRTGVPASWQLFARALTRQLGSSGGSCNISLVQEIGSRDWGGVLKKELKKVYLILYS